MKLIVKSIVAVPTVSFLIILPGPGCCQAVAQFEEIHANAPLTDPAAQETVAAAPFPADHLVVNPKPNEFKRFSMSPVSWRVFSRVRVVAGQPTAATAGKNFLFSSRFSSRKPMPAGFREHAAAQNQDGYFPPRSEYGAPMISNSHTTFSERIRRPADAVVAGIKRRLTSAGGLEMVMDGRRWTNDLILNPSKPIRADVAGGSVALRVNLSPSGKSPISPTRAETDASSAFPEVSAPESPSKSSQAAARNMRLIKFTQRGYGTLRLIGSLAVILAALVLGWCIWDYYQWKHVFEIIGIPVLGNLTWMPALGLGTISANPSGWRKPVKTSTLLIIAGLIAGAILGILNYWI